MSRTLPAGCSRAAATGAMLLAGVVLGGCAPDAGTEEPPDQTKAAPVDELSRHQGRVCPDRLPQRQDPGHGFGNREPAAAPPSLASPESGWVCVYDPVEAGPGPRGGGTTLRWERSGSVHRVPSSDLASLESHLSDLVPPDAGRLCTAELGPRWMFVYAVGDDLTGVVVDDYGCRDVRLTDQPFETPPGDAVQPGIVSGVLSGRDSLVADLKALVQGP